MTAAARKRRYRERQRRSIAVYPVPVPAKVIETAINANWLSEDDAHDRDKVGKMIANIMAEWHERWRDYFGTRAHSADLPTAKQLRETPERSE